MGALPDLGGGAPKDQKIGSWEFEQLILLLGKGWKRNILWYVMIFLIIHAYQYPWTVAQLIFEHAFHRLFSPEIYNDISEQFVQGTGSKVPHAPWGGVLSPRRIFDPKGRAISMMLEGVPAHGNQRSKLVILVYINHLYCTFITI